MRTRQPTPTLDQDADHQVRYRIGAEKSDRHEVMAAIARLLVSLDRAEKQDEQQEVPR